MTRRRRLRCRSPHANALAAFCFALLACVVVVRQTDAASLEDYRTRVLRATDAMEELHTAFDEADDTTTPEFLASEAKTIAEVRAALPATEKIEGTGAAFDVDNRWLHTELDLYAKIAPDQSNGRDDALYRLAGRLHALATQLTEAADAGQAARDKEAEKGRLQAILRRPEYNQQAAEDTAFERFKKQVKEWLNSMMPKSRPLSQGTASTFSFIARIFVFVLTAAVIIYVLWKYGALLLPRNRAKKKSEAEARIVLGERLAPGQTPAGLISEAEALARAGDLRGAIRKAYIAVLFELGERRILRLAAHKTNRDYLSAIRRERAALYGDMQPLTNNYERHWYGFAPATDADWHDFRTRCQQAIKVSS
ncbi:MAG TPA: DUF4129 domain-containing protein [Pyrinomonadaceae bacterium]|jgi:hypothetical protein|nr:DUF4129 domain-containing protein [Pyrinomonadaceae bacterium]